MAAIPLKPTLSAKSIQLNILRYINKFGPLLSDCSLIKSECANTDSYSLLLYFIILKESDVSLKIEAIDMLLKEGVWKYALLSMVVIFRTQKHMSKTQQFNLLSLIHNLLSSNMFQRKFQLTLTLEEALESIEGDSLRSCGDEEMQRFLNDEHIFLSIFHNELLPELFHNCFSSFTAEMAPRTIKVIENILMCESLPSNVHLLLDVLRNAAVSSDIKTMISTVFNIRCQSTQNTLLLCKRVFNEYIELQNNIPLSFDDLSSFQILLDFIQRLHTSKRDEICKEMLTDQEGLNVLQQSFGPYAVACCGFQYVSPSQRSDFLNEIASTAFEGLDFTLLNLWLRAFAIETCTLDRHDIANIEKNLYPQVLLCSTTMSSATRLSLRMHKSELQLYKAIALLQDEVFNSEGSEVSQVFLYLYLIRLSINETASYVKDNWRKNKSSINVSEATKDSDDYLAKTKQAEQSEELLAAKLEVIPVFAHTVVMVQF